MDSYNDLIKLIDIIHAFFSTISYNLEGNKWESKYPMLMNELY